MKWEREKREEGGNTLSTHQTSCRTSLSRRAMRHSAWNSPAAPSRQGSASSSSFATSNSNTSPWNPLPPNNDGASSSQSGPDRVQSVLDRVLAQLDGFEVSCNFPPSFSIKTNSALSLSHRTMEGLRDTGRDDIWHQKGMKPSPRLSRVVLRSQRCVGGGN